ncbi:DNA-binding cell division cycle control protein [Plasmopara halstedii]|uniref:DNA-binding cell division cycle control protein n=1 Tax=Plasmopara halstedii TaxID=4781 RepID=A0A0N7L7V2_PLAHL|nr:DNA-binding cell division cycle control protein [Plasmopara halstedii]CEG48107.1 DNA-binding cell division cycle control protein [Plasmopara halstedii]|eukprot:XP_024584476.1 DNA-binding cell division cycle control protein [Plasmopara halstedii]
MASAVEVALIKQIQRYLDTFVYDNARFLAERLVAHNPNEENLLLLATCYFRKGQAAQAAAVLNGATSADNRYLLASCCFQLNRLIETESALLGGESYHIVDLDALKNVPAGAAGLYLLGRVCRRGNRRQQAIACFVRSLEMDPFMWSAYEELCELGANLEATRFFGAANYFKSSEMVHADVENDLRPEFGDLLVRSRQDFSDEDDNHLDILSDGNKFAYQEPTLHLGLDSPKSSIKKEVNSSRPSIYKTPKTECDRLKYPHRTTFVKKSVVEDIRAPSRLKKSHRRPRTDSDENFQANARLSFSFTEFDSTLSNIPKVLQGESISGRQTCQVKESVIGSTRDVEYFHQMDGRHELLRLLNSFGSIYYKLSLYLCREALEMLEQLPATQRASGWAQQHFARAYFELADYVQAREIYCSLYRLYPHRMECLDLYSTTLWHLKKEVELSYLAQQATDFDKLSCEAWCVAGNCFSLQKEHDTALTFFQRAIQLNPSYTYAYTLSGHEYVANEDFEKAVNCYRHAIRTDSRHYNAWRALEINPRSSLLHCFLGMVQHATHRYDDALVTLEHAADLQPLNPQARFQRANVLITLQRYHEALEELHIVKNFAPRESSVYFMMGKVAKKLGNIEEAMKFFCMALHFHPKDNNQIKAAIDKMNEPDNEDDDDRI